MVYPFPRTIFLCCCLCSNPKWSFFVAVFDSAQDKLPLPFRLARSFLEMQSEPAGNSGGQHSAALSLCDQSDLLYFDLDIDTATASLVNKAYRKKAMKVHPDTAEFRELKEKYNALLCCFQAFAQLQNEHSDISFAQCVRLNAETKKKKQVFDTAPPWHVDAILRTKLVSIFEALEWLPDDMLELSRKSLATKLLELQPGDHYTVKIRNVSQPCLLYTSPSPRD